MTSDWIYSQLSIWAIMLKQAFAGVVRDLVGGLGGDLVDASVWSGVEEIGELVRMFGWFFHH